MKLRRHMERNEDAARAAEALEKAAKELQQRQAEARHIRSLHARWRRTRERNHISAGLVELWTGGKS